MAYALDLSPRQSARTLEQAARHRAEVRLEPRIRDGEAPIPCRLVAIEVHKVSGARRSCLTLEPCPDTIPDDRGDGQVLSETGKPQGSAAPWAGLAGSYCDATVQLGENRYLFSSEVLGVGAGPDGPGQARIYLARPEAIQVAQRRRYQRFRPAQSAHVELRWANPDRSRGGGVGWLCNVCAEGMACRTEARIADQIGIGERLEIQFALTPGDADYYKMHAVLCSKTPAGTQGRIILGLQFLIGEGHEESVRSAELLRKKLLARYNALVSTA